MATLAAGLLLWWIPNERLGDPVFLERASPADLKATAERVLLFPIGNHHDACLHLGRVGDASSVPSLLRALRWLPDGDVVPCTTIHCYDALRRITGQDAGSTREAWVAWWGRAGR